MLQMDLSSRDFSAPPPPRTPLRAPLVFDGRHLSALPHRTEPADASYPPPLLLSHLLLRGVQADE